MSDQFKILSARDHTRARPGMYLGSVSLEKVDRFVLGKWQTTQYVPALLKMVDEIIDNCIDESIRTNFKHANEITVQTKKDRVVIADNGRGIPHDEIVDTETRETMLRPVAAWTRVRAGTSFEDDRVTIGANGVGSACVNFMSKMFIGETWQKNRLIKVTSTNGAEKSQMDDSMSRAGSGTRVEFRPDFSLLGVDSLEDGDHLELISDRLTGLQIAFPEIKFKLNGRLVAATTLKKYAALYTEEDASTVVAGRDSLSYFFASSTDGYRSTTYVNGVHTRLGGAYNDFVVNAVVDEMTSMIKRKYKVEVGKSTIKGGLTFVLFARSFKNPQFDSQTKERLTNSQAQIREHYNAAGVPDAMTIAKKIMSCADIIEPIVEAQVAKKAASDKRAATLAQKKLRRAKVQKHVAATSKNSTLFLCEGDSAMGFLLKVRDPKTVGGFPLRGVVKNTWDAKPADVLKNKELGELISVLGLDINNPDSVDTMDYEHIATLADADHDGNHITGLLMAFFYRFWPRLFEENRVHMTRTPIMISTKGDKVKWFYSYTDVKTFKASASGWKHRYIKGLASLTEEEYDKIINQPQLSTINIDKPAWFEVMCGEDTAPRKDWIQGQTPELIK
jgi:DNA gyrase/topoisomerase IV subunit B